MRRLSRPLGMFECGEVHVDCYLLARINVRIRVERRQVFTHNLFICTSNFDTVLLYDHLHYNNSIVLIRHSDRPLDPSSALEES
jgi:hypothetical protein